MLSSELLLELTNQARLDLLELLELGEGNIDDDALLASNLDLLQDITLNIKDREMMT